MRHHHTKTAPREHFPIIDSEKAATLAAQTKLARGNSVLTRFEVIELHQTARQLSNTRLTMKSFYTPFFASTWTLFKRNRTLF